jgi:hypothetical protein
LAIENVALWTSFALSWLDQPGWRAKIAEVTFAMPCPPEELLQAILNYADGLAETVWCVCLRKQVTESTLTALLRLKDSAVAGAAALLDEALRRERNLAIYGVP